MSAANMVRVLRETEFQLNAGMAWNRWRVEWQHPESGRWLLLAHYPTHSWAIREADRIARRVTVSAA